MNALYLTDDQLTAVACSVELMTMALKDAELRPLPEEVKERNREFLIHCVVVGAILRGNRPPDLAKQADSV